MEWAGIRPLPSHTAQAGMPMPGVNSSDSLAALEGPVRDWFASTFPDGPTPAQSLAWPLIASGANLLLVSPTGTGKTLAAFLAIINGLYREHTSWVIL